MNENAWYYLDPDNRKDSPDAPHCCRCKKKMKALPSAISWLVVEIHPIHPWVRNNPWGKSLIGKDCWDLIVKEGGVSQPD